MGRILTLAAMTLALLCSAVVAQDHSEAARIETEQLSKAKWAESNLQIDALYAELEFRPPTSEEIEWSYSITNRVTIRPPQRPTCENRMPNQRACSAQMYPQIKPDGELWISCETAPKCSKATALTSVFRGFDRSRSEYIGGTPLMQILAETDEQCVIAVMGKKGLWMQSLWHPELQTIGLMQGGQAVDFCYADIKAGLVRFLKNGVEVNYMSTHDFDTVVLTDSPKMAPKPLPFGTSIKMDQFGRAPLKFIDARRNPRPHQFETIGGVAIEPGHYRMTDKQIEAYSQRRGVRVIGLDDISPVTSAVKFTESCFE